MAMTRKHYQAFADLINSARREINSEGIPDDFNIGKHYTIGWIASSMAFLFEDYNPRFDRKKFMEACGISED